MSIFDHIDPDETVYASSQGETGPVDLDDPWGMDAALAETTEPEAWHHEFPGRREGFDPAPVTAAAWEAYERGIRGTYDLVQAAVWGAPPLRPPAFYGVHTPTGTSIDHGALLAPRFAWKSSPGVASPNPGAPALEESRRLIEAAMPDLGKKAPPAERVRIIPPLEVTDAGEVIDSEIVEDDLPVSEAAAVLTSVGSRVHDVDALASVLRTQLIERVDKIADAGRAAREARTGQVERTRVEQLAPEVRAMAEAEGALSTVGAAFQAAAKHAKGHLADLVVESLAPDEAEMLESHGGSRSLRVGDSRPGAKSVRVTVTRSRQLWTEDRAILDAVTGLLVERHAEQVDGESPEDAGERVGYADGVEAGIETVLSLLASPKFTISKLKLLREQAEAEGRDGIARALGAAYGQKVKDGEPTVKVERVQEAIEGEAVSE